MFYLRPKTEKLEYGGRYDKLPTGTLAGGGADGGRVSPTRQPAALLQSLQ